MKKLEWWQRRAAEKQGGRHRFFPRTPMHHWDRYYDLLDRTGHDFDGKPRKRRIKIKRPHN